MTIARILKGMAAGIFVLSLPVLFGTLSLRWLVADVGWYRDGFQKNGVSERTGISPQELDRSAGQISRYLLLQADNVDIPVTIRGQVRALFNDRELKHMVDVRNLLARFYTLQVAAAGYAVVYLLASRLWHRGDYWQALGRKLRWGGGLTIGLFAAFGALSMVDFDELFLRFHLVSFNNDFWMLDPTRDNLVMMFPQDFWYDSTIRLSVATGAQALGAALAGTILTRLPWSGEKRKEYAEG